MADYDATVDAISEELEGEQAVDKRIAEIDATLDLLRQEIQSLQNERALLLTKVRRTTT